MSLSEADRAFLADNHRAAMITVTPEGVAKVVRVAVVLMDGRLWSSGTQDRVRTKRLREDPRCTLFVWDEEFSWVGLETVVRLLEGPSVPDESVRLFREMQGRPEGPLLWYGRELDEAAFRQTMIEEDRLIYEFDVRRSYGMH